MAETTTDNEVITKANFSTGWLGTYSDKTTTNSTIPEWYYVSAFSFVVHCYINITLLQNPTLIVTCHCYNWETASWEQVFHYDRLQVHYPTQSSDRRYLKFFHNRDTESDAADYTKNFRDTETSRKTALFRFRLERNTGSSNLETGIKIYYGGIGMLTDNEYTKYVKDRPIISNGQLGSDVDNFVWYGGRTGTAPDDEAIAKFNPENTKGTVIKKENEYNCVPKWF